MASTIDDPRHVFQGRYKAIIVQKESYLLELARYVVLNPVRAGMVRGPDEWPWSSYRATAGLCNGASWLTTDWLLAAFSGLRGEAAVRYAAFVADGQHQPGPWGKLKNQIFLGSDTFVATLQDTVDKDAPLGKFPPFSVGHSRNHWRELPRSMIGTRRFSTRMPAADTA